MIGRCFLINYSKCFYFEAFFHYSQQHSQILKQQTSKNLSASSFPLFSTITQTEVEKRMRSRIINDLVKMDRKQFLTHFQNVCAFLTSFDLFGGDGFVKMFFLMTKVNLDINSYLFFLFRFFLDEME